VLSGHHALSSFRAPYYKLKSVSTGDLLETRNNAEWLLKCASSDMERRVLFGGSTVAEDYHFTVCHCQIAVQTEKRV